MRHVLAALITSVFAGSFCPGFAWSQSLTGNVGSAGISDGSRSIEFRTGFDDDGNLAGRIHYDQALTGWYQFRVIGAFRKPDGGDLDFSGVTLENWLQWAEEGRDGTGFNGGLRLSYTRSEAGAPDEAAIRLTLTDKFAGNWEWRANAIGETEIGGGRDDGFDLETRLQLTRALPVALGGTRDWRLGGEIFSEYGNIDAIPGLNRQAHQAGPVIKAEWDNGIYLQAALRAGLTDGADDFMGKIFIGREF